MNKQLVSIFDPHHQRNTVTLEKYFFPLIQTKVVVINSGKRDRWSLCRSPLTVPTTPQPPQRGAEEEAGENRGPRRQRPSQHRQQPRQRYRPPWPLQRAEEEEEAATTENAVGRPMAAALSVGGAELVGIGLPTLTTVTVVASMTRRAVMESVLRIIVGVLGMRAHISSMEGSV